MNPDPLYMVRDAAFGMNFTPKLWASLIAIGLVLWDWRTQRRRDYVWVFVIASVLWGLIEFTLATRGIRDMPTRLLFGQPLPLPVSCLMQGTSEVALVTVAALFAGDRFLGQPNRRRVWAFIVVGLLVVVASTLRRAPEGVAAEVVGSRRNMLDPRAMVMLALMAVAVAAFVVVARQWRPRFWAMFVGIVVTAAVWTTAEVIGGGRWVEVATATGFERAGPGLTVVGLAFDVVVEIAVANSVFFVLPVVLRLLRDPTPLPVVSGRGSQDALSSTASAARP